MTTIGKLGEWESIENLIEQRDALVEQLEALQKAYEKQNKELEQFRQVAGLDPIKYPNGRRLPDADLMQDPAYLAFQLGKLENVETEDTTLEEAFHKASKQREDRAKVITAKVGESVERPAPIVDFEE